MSVFKYSAAAMLTALLVPVSGAIAHDSHDHALEAARVSSMQEATLAFLVSLDDEQRAKASASLDDNSARTSWSNLPVIMAPRAGVAVKEMTNEQRRAFHAMMAAAFSSQGYLKTTTIIWHEDVLHTIVADFVASLPDDNPRKAQGLQFIENYDSELFFVSVFGDPNSQNWAWTVTGHHYAANFTIADGKIAFMPLFLGANPQVITSGKYAGWRILQHEADRAFAFLDTLDESQLSTVVIADVVDGDVFAGHGNQLRGGAPIGIKASELAPLQRRLLWRLIDEYLEDASDEAALRQRNAIAQDGMETLHFAWWGPTDDPAARYMFRIHGPSILIDYVRERSADGGYNHVHSIARDPSNDYGADWLKLHYEEAHQE
jgi:Protein of unknown function (DUF3500)